MRIFGGREIPIGTKGEGILRHLLRVTTLLAVLCAVVAAPGSAVPGPQVHGIGFAKGCLSPTAIGDPYECFYTILNNTDTAHDSLTIHSIVDHVHAFGGNV